MLVRGLLYAPRAGWESMSAGRGIAHMLAELGYRLDCGGGTAGDIGQEPSGPKALCDQCKYRFRTNTGPGDPVRCPRCSHGFIRRQTCRRGS